jgi:hypothetical protein
VAYGLALHSELNGDGSLCNATLMQRDHLLVALESSLSPLAAELLRTSQSRGGRSGRWRSNGSNSGLSESLFEHRGMACQDVFQRFTQIAQQMETICYLYGFWRTQAGSFGVGPGTITADHFWWSVLAQPFGNGVGLAVGQKVYHAVPLQITKRRAFITKTGEIRYTEPRARPSGQDNDR